MKRLLFILVLLLPVNATAAGGTTRAVLDQRAQVLDAAIEARKFDDVEAAVRELMRPTAEKTRINDSALFTVVGGLFKPSALRFQAAMEEWVAKRPRSVIAAALYAAWLHEWAWEARGTKFIQSVPGEAAKIYSERLSRVKKELDRAESLDKGDLLVTYLRLAYGKEFGVSGDEQRQLFEALNEMQPNSWAIHSKYLEGLSPKWGGASEDNLFKEARRLANAAPKNSAIVALIVVAQNLVCAEHGGKKEYFSDATAWAERERAYRELLKRFPEAGYFAASLASDAFLVNRKELGVEMLRLAVRVEADNPEVIAVNRRYGQLLENQSELGGTPGVERSDVTAVLEQAGAAYKAKRFAEAERLYRQATEMHPTRANSWHMLGSMIAQQGRYNDAIAPFAKAAELSPKRASYFTHLCHARMMSGQIEQGVEDCTTAIGIDSSEKFAYLNRAQAYRMLGKHREAEADMKVADSLK